jgi:hypothetical protein
MKCRVTVSDRNNNGNKNEVQEINQLIHYTKNRKKILVGANANMMGTGDSTFHTKRM